MTCVPALDMACFVYWPTLRQSNSKTNKQTKKRFPIKNTTSLVSYSFWTWLGLLEHISGSMLLQCQTPAFFRPFLFHIILGVWYYQDKKFIFGLWHGQNANFGALGRICTSQYLRLCPTMTRVSVVILALCVIYYTHTSFLLTVQRLFNILPFSFFCVFFQQSRKISTHYSFKLYSDIVVMFP